MPPQVAEPTSLHSPQCILGIGEFQRWKRRLFKRCTQLKKAAEIAITRNIERPIDAQIPFLCPRRINVIITPGLRCPKGLNVQSNRDAATTRDNGQRNFSETFSDPAGSFVMA